MYYVKTFFIRKYEPQVIKNFYVYFILDIYK